MNRSNIVVTSRGIGIGSAYTEPPPAPSFDAELVQSALLNTAPHYAERALDFLERNLGKLAASIIIGGLVFGMLKRLLA